MYAAGFEALIAPLSMVFTKPTFSLFHVLVAGMLTVEGRRTIAGAIRAAGQTERYVSIYRFLSHRVWSATELGVQLLFLILATVGNVPLVFVLDDTLVKRFGKKIWGRAWHRETSNKENEPEFIRGHCWLLMGLVFHSKVLAKWVCLPFWARLFVPRSGKDGKSAKRSKVEMAAAMVRLLARILKKPFLLVVDGAYAAKALIQECRRAGSHIVSRLKKSAALYAIPPAREPKRRGRPRKYGRRLPPLNTLASELNEFLVVRVPIYGETKEVLVRILDVMWKSSADPIRVVITRLSPTGVWAAHFTTDPLMTEDQIIRHVASRWTIETANKDLKEFGWLTHMQVRLRRSVNRAGALACTAFTLLHLWYLRSVEKGEIIPSIESDTPWYGQKATISTLDMLRALSTKNRAARIFQLFHSHARKSRKIELRQVEQLLAA